MAASVDVDYFSFVVVVTYIIERVADLRSSRYRGGRDSILHFANTDDVQLRHVRREKKKLIVRDQWTIEMTEEAFWTMEKPFMPYQINPLNEPPSQVLYSLSVSVAFIE